MTKFRSTPLQRTSRTKTGFSILAAVITILGAQQIAASPTFETGAGPILSSGYKS